MNEKKQNIVQYYNAFKHSIQGNRRVLKHYKSLTLSFRIFFSEYWQITLNLFQEPEENGKPPAVNGMENIEICV